jgi:hypothetical protein
MTLPSPLRPKMLSGGLVQFDQTPPTPTVVNVIAFQYNPDTLTRTLTPRAIGGEPGDRLEVLRLTGPPKETIKLEAEFDLADNNPQFVSAPSLETQDVGLLSTLAALEALITPTTTQLANVDALFRAGQIEVAPMEAPLTLLVWGPKRIVPVLLTSLTLTEEAFGPQLQPIRAKVSLEMKTLTSNDFPADSPGEARYLAYRTYSEAWAKQVTTRNPSPLGIESIS